MKGSLIGTYIHNVDEKGRLAVPSKMRMELGDPFYITCLTSDCLLMYSQDEWQKFADKLNAIPQTNINAQRYVRMIFSNACKCEPDKQGRVLLPQLLRERVGIDKEVVTIGASYRAEIWAKEKWQGYLDDMPEDENAAMSELSIFGI
ncbi:MAG: division/cell wall cluster transcriptional repressor MraZ [Eubacteriales bacterium]|nr:division/cell wall cluster transcriptional repressor MraZ [Eubacteriales bacterium]